MNLTLFKNCLNEVQILQRKGEIAFFVHWSTPLMTTTSGAESIQARSFLWISHLRAESLGLRPSSAAFLSHKQGASWIGRGAVVT